MKRAVKSGIVFVITLVILIVIFWIVLPLLGIDDIFGQAYFVVAIIGSFLLSTVISRFVAKLLFKEGR